MLHREPDGTDLGDHGGCRCHPRQRGDGLGRPEWDWPPSRPTPVINLTGHGGPCGGRHDHLQAVRAGRHVRGAALYTSPTVTVSGNGTYGTPAPQFVPDGSRARTTGSPCTAGARRTTAAATHNAACTDTNEDVEVTSVPSSLTSAQTMGAERLGDRSRSRQSSGRDRRRTSTSSCFTGGTCQGTALYTPAGRVAVTTACRRRRLRTPRHCRRGTYSWRVNYDSTGNDRAAATSPNVPRNLDADDHERRHDVLQQPVSGRDVDAAR